MQLLWVEGEGEVVDVVSEEGGGACVVVDDEHNIYTHLHSQYSVTIVLFLKYYGSYSYNFLLGK